MDLIRNKARRGGPLGRRRAEGAAACGPASACAARRGGFTLTELLIVIGLIVLVLALAVPAFQAMTGGRSIDAAQNQLSAVLGAARSEAIGLQKVRGVFFYVDPGSERVNAAIVQEVGLRPAAAPDDPPDFYIDLVPDRDPIALPVGVGLQGIDGSDVTAGTTTSSARRDDGYLGYNVPNVSPAPPSATVVRYGGVILFDGYGRLVNKRYGFHLGQGDPTRPAIPLKATLMGALLGYIPSGQNTPPPVPEIFIPRQNVPGNLGENTFAPRSQFGFVLYDLEPYRGRGFTAEDPQLSNAPYAQPEQDEEKWLDQNGLPVLINRYNGTLVRGE